MLPTYAQHAGRRATEMSELEATARDAGVTPRVIEGVVKFHEALAEAMGEQPVSLSPVLGGVGGREGHLPEHRATNGNGKSPSRASPPGTGERENAAAAHDLPSAVRAIADHLTERETV
jgi:hypothetical protein